MSTRTISSLHPVQAIFLAGTVPLFLGVLLSDYAYFRTYEVQWKNFASWLIVGGLFFGGMALLWALIERIRAGWGASRQLVYLVVLMAAWVFGLINAFVHAADAWASMPEGLILSGITAMLVVVATGLGFFGIATEDRP